jgi:predicted dehydrogenase
MEISRRKFIQKTGIFAAGTCLLLSCKTGYVRMGFVGPEEHFRYYIPMFQKLKGASVEMSSLELALESDLHAVFIDSHPNTKSVEILLLLEKNKDIITPYPLVSSRYEYNKVQEYLDLTKRRLGMLNPLPFYPAVSTLKDWLSENNPDLTEIRVNCHPEQLTKGYPVFGYAGAVQPLQRMISFITGKFPVSLFIEQDKTNSIRRWILDYESFQATIQTDPEQTGWVLQAEGPQLSVLVDHTGLLRLNDEVKPRHSPAQTVWARSIIRNLEDFLRAVRTRTEPQVNSLDGLSAIILTDAAGQSIRSGIKVDL